MSLSCYTLGNVGISWGICPDTTQSGAPIFFEIGDNEAWKQFLYNYRLRPVPYLSYHALLFQVLPGQGLALHGSSVNYTYKDLVDGIGSTDGRIRGLGSFQHSAFALLDGVSLNQVIRVPRSESLIDPSDGPYIL